MKTVICKTKFDLIFFKNFIKNKAKNEKYSILNRINFLIANQQYPVVFYLKAEETTYSNLEYYNNHKKEFNCKLIDINLLIRKQKLNKLLKIF